MQRHHEVTQQLSAQALPFWFLDCLRSDNLQPRLLPLHWLLGVTRPQVMPDQLCIQMACTWTC